ncbi:MAG: preprotein translocase subunit SecE [Microthrixaceae bacterium]
MAKNREMKRMLQRQGEVGADGQPVRQKRQAPRQPAPKKSGEKEARLFSRQGVREVRAELRKVVWPTRAETINYSIITLVTLVIVTTLIFCIDWVFSKGVLFLFQR